MGQTHTHTFIILNICTPSASHPHLHTGTQTHRHTNTYIHTQTQHSLWTKHGTFRGWKFTWLYSFLSVTALYVKCKRRRTNVRRPLVNETEMLSTMLYFSFTALLCTRQLYYCTPSDRYHHNEKTNSFNGWLLWSLKRAIHKWRIATQSLALSLPLWLLTQLKLHITKELLPYCFGFGIFNVVSEFEFHRLHLIETYFKEWHI